MLKWVVGEEVFVFWLKFQVFLQLRNVLVCSNIQSKTTHSKLKIGRKGSEERREGEKRDVVEEEEEGGR